MTKASHLNQRRIEAALVGRLYSQMRRFLDQESALCVVSRTLDESATQEGRGFSEEAKQGASLSHFKTIRDLWGDALKVEVVEDEESVFRFNVVRCEYFEAYRDLGLPPELVRILSCARDAPFAHGYSELLEFTREGTIADGAAACDFCYRWVSPDEWREETR